MSKRASEVVWGQSSSPSDGEKRWRLLPIEGPWDAIFRIEAKNEINANKKK